MSVSPAMVPRPPMVAHENIDPSSVRLVYGAGSTLFSPRQPSLPRSAEIAFEKETHEISKHSARNRGCSVCQVTQLVTPSISFIRVVLPIAVQVRAC
jgi:hypothetical protein